MIRLGRLQRMVWRGRADELTVQHRTSHKMSYPYSLYEAKSEDRLVVSTVPQCTIRVGYDRPATEVS